MLFASLPVLWNFESWFIESAAGRFSGDIVTDGLRCMPLAPPGPSSFLMSGDSGEDDDVSLLMTELLRPCITLFTTAGDGLFEFKKLSLLCRWEPLFVWRSRCLAHKS